MPALNNVENVIMNGSRNPFGLPSLLEMMKIEYKVVILGDDITRLIPQNFIIPVLLNELNAFGVPDKKY